MATVTYSLKEAAGAFNARSNNTNPDYTVNPGYTPGGGDPRLTFSFTLDTALAPNTTTTLIYRDVEGKNVPGTQVLSFNFNGGGLGTSLSDADMATSYFGNDGSGNLVRTSFRATATTDAAGVITSYDFRGASLNVLKPKLFTTFSIIRSPNDISLSVAAGSVSMVYRFIVGSVSCAIGCTSVGAEFASTTGTDRRSAMAAGPGRVGLGQQFQNPRAWRCYWQG